MLWFVKPECSILSISTAVRGTAGIDKEALPSAKRRLDGGEGRTMMNPRGYGGSYNI
jgi:hypothetical protein